MLRRIVDGKGRAWEVSPSGRRTQYGHDEVSLEFRLAGSAERRYVRFSPRGPRAVELAFDATSDAELVHLLAASQPAWTSPDGGYRGR